MLVNNLKALLVVAVLAALVFVLARPLALRFMTEQAFVRRRNAWFLLTATAFLSPNFWIFSAVTAVVAARLARDEPNPLALYLFLAFLVPPLRFGLSYGTLGIADLNIYRLLALVVLVPWTLRHMQSPQPDPTGRRKLFDTLIIAFGVLHVLSMMPYEPVTRTGLSAVLFVLDTWLIYYVASRSCLRKQQIVEVLACFALVGALLAVLGMFEHLRRWPLYGSMSNQWGYFQAFVYREGSLRALVTSGHPLGLGYFCGIAFGTWLYLSKRIGSWKVAASGAAWMWMGLIAAVSRAPWLMAGLLYLAYTFFATGSLSKFFKTLVALGAAGAVVLMTPFGERIIDLLPFVGTVESRNVEYRQQLLEASWTLVQQNPWFGDRFITSRMDDLLNSQGIVDLVNGYVLVALHYGLVGLALYTIPQIAALLLAGAAMRRLRAVDADYAALGALLVACMLATIFYQLSSGTMWMQYVLIGLSIAYASIGQRHVQQRRAASSAQPPLAGAWPARRV